MLDPEVRIVLSLKSAGHYVTREELAQASGVDTSGVTAAIDDLLSRGYRIDVVPGEGYRLVAAPDTLDGTDLKTALRGSRLGQEILTFGKVASTNDIAIALARAGGEEGTIVVAEEQSRGRGRLGRYWHSPRGCGLWFSVILKPPLAASDSTKVSLAGALGIADALRERYGVKARIKWPNDVVVQARKICGILTESEFMEDRVRFVVMGVGLNVLNAEGDFPEDIRRIATSLRIETGAEDVARSDVLASVLKQITHRYMVLCNDGFEKIRQDLLAHSLLIGKVIKVAIGKGHVEGVAHDIDTTGALVIRKDSGTFERIVAGDVVGIMGIT
jgi:BirA family biotin operon repressor/biotin-[acetyl-CoA-carboxylase] ligase